MEETINKIQKKFQKEKRDLMQPLKNLMDKNKIAFWAGCVLYHREKGYISLDIVKI